MGIWWGQVILLCGLYFEQQCMNSYTQGKMRRGLVGDQSQNHPTKSKHRVLNEANRRPEQEQKSITRKSIEVNLSHHQKAAGVNTIYQTGQPTKPHYRRVSHNFRKGFTRYEDEERDNTRLSSKSPYLRAPTRNQQPQQRDLVSRSSALNRSTQKMRSGQLLKQNSPRYFYRQPRSSLSQHYDPSIEHSLHKRRVSVVGEERNEALEQAKELYKAGSYGRSVEVLRKYMRGHKGSTEGRYLLGMSLINNSEFQLGIEQLVQLVGAEPHYKKSLYLVIALAYKRIEEYDAAIAILDKGIEAYPDYYDCLVYRGKLHLKKESYFHALKDFTQAIELNPSKGFAYVGKGTCEKEAQQFDQAIATFTAGLNTQMAHICRQKRAAAHYDHRDYAAAMQDLEVCASREGAHSSAVHYYKGMVNYKQGRLMEATLSFEETLKCDNHREHVTSAVEMMMQMKVEEKDFYEAYHILTRADNVEVNTEVLNEWRLFLEASLFLMKKKYKEGISAFKSLLTVPLFGQSLKEVKGKAAQHRYAFLKPLIHLYKAFGELSEDHPEQAETDYCCYDQFCRQMGVSEQNLSKDYNRLIIRAYREFPASSHKLIEEAMDLIPCKPQPHLYLAFDLIRNQFMDESDPIAKQQHLTTAIGHIGGGIGHLPQLSNNHISTFYYYRSVLLLFRNDFNGAVADVDKAIEKSEDNIPKYFYLRGLIFAVFGNFSQAVQDLTVAINLDEKYAKPYLERAKCLQIQGSSNEAFLDLQRYITLAPEDTNIHKYAGYLLFQNCAYEDCLSAFSHGPPLANDSQLLLTKAKCHFLLGEDGVALPLFRQHAELAHTEEYQSDIAMMEVCGGIRASTTRGEYMQWLSKIDQVLENKKEGECKIFKLRDMHQLKASIYLLLAEYDEAEMEFGETLRLFGVEKQKEMERHFIEDSEEFEDQWSQVEIKFNLAFCYLCRANYSRALDMLRQFQNSSEKGRNWAQMMELLEQLAQGSVPEGKVELNTFEQNHRISRLWPKIKLPQENIELSMAFSYPFVEPPQLMPEFDMDFFSEFDIKNSQSKPEAPWINRKEGGLVFTPNVQVYDNLQLSMTTTKKNDTQHNKPISEMERSQELSESMMQLQGDDLKRKFKLDSMVEMKLKKLMNRKE